MKKQHNKRKRNEEGKGEGKSRKKVKKEESEDDEDKAPWTEHDSLYHNAYVELKDLQVQLEDAEAGQHDMQEYCDWERKELYEPAQQHYNEEKEAAETHRASHDNCKCRFPGLRKATREWEESQRSLNNVLEMRDKETVRVTELRAKCTEVEAKMARMRALHQIRPDLL
ncbi:hypothetical protein V5O48_002821 [Marasmius crinis-equi]|uniref:Uncharacterized protein n=1 Tax=Marasmius crinis-equi TaxID=585013 RepID=A0ABR3FUL8_9AGAR